MTPYRRSDWSPNFPPIVITLLIILALVLLAGCAGMATPKTFTERADVIEQGITGLRGSATIALTNGAITVKQAIAVQAAADAGRQSLDAARAVHAQACPATVAAKDCTSANAEANLQAVTTGLNAWVAFLATQGVKK